MKFMSFAALMLIGTSAFAADQYNFKLIGFSKDNSKVAFSESVLADGSCNAYATVSVVDVKANNLLKRVNQMDENPTGECASEAKALKGALAKANLKAFGIDEKIKGEVLLEKLATDLSVYKEIAFAQHPNLTKYSLVLSESAAKSDQCFDQETPSMFKLTMNHPDENGKPVSIVLQEDKVLPKSRGCALSYGIAKVVKSGDALVVIMTKKTPGFEGPDTSFMAVTVQKKLD